MAKTVDKELMRENIIQAAINAFLKNGVNNSTMELIAKEANIAKGTLYLYFNSKQELISACNVAHYTERKALLMLPKIFDSLDELLEHVSKSLFIKKKMAEYIKIFFEAFGAQLSTKSFTDEYNSFFEEIANSYEQSLKNLIKKGLVKDSINTFTFSRTMVSMMDGLTLHRGFFDIDDERYKGMVNDTVQMYRAILER
ncbi:TetR/AcrR family transcriptional regulator [Campylobacter sp.]|uniref:TetR/AcrR family transcriptional regulator n=1 Tax=Campylobacter sp. TaxID=205 RepID=UPI00291091B1|nr:TetR/AcrR family transcriptional regulator [Campylobacter sp.]MDU6828393.1 TetR/AcrR family transcriptional regulator [Campylobacter sp.]